MNAVLHIPRTRADRGFSLIEMIVSVGIFSTVMIVAVGSLLSIVDANRKAQAQQIVINNLNFALENMSRNIRIGSYYHCGSSLPLSTKADCNNGDSYFAFEGREGNTSQTNDQIVYRLSNSQIEKSTDGGTTFIGITAPEIVIEGLSFYVDGAAAGDQKQPKVLMTVYGHTGISNRARVDFNLQTMISQRAFDI